MKRFSAGDARYFFIVIALILSAILYLPGCSDKSEEGAPSGRGGMMLPVEVGKVEFRSIVDEVRAVGNIVADQRVTLKSEVKGKLVEFPVKEGQHVRLGDLIAQIDPREYRLQVERLHADLISAQKDLDMAEEGARPEDQARLKAQEQARASALDLARKEEVRFRKLVEEGVISQSQYDTAKDRVLQAEESFRSSQAERAAGKKGREEDILKMRAQLESMAKQLEMAELDLEKTSVTAPYDGVILTREVEVGAYLKDGDSVAEMIGASSLKALIELPQSYRSRLKELREIEFYVPELNIRFKEKSRLKTRVRIIPDASIFSGNIQAQVELSNPDPKLFPGVTLEARLRFDVRKNVKHVPSISLVIGEQGTIVYVARDGKAALVPVKAGLERDGWVEVTDFTHQLTKQTQLIVRGSGAVFPGASVMATIGGPKGPPGGGPPGAGPPGKPKGKKPGGGPPEKGKGPGGPSKGSAKGPAKGKSPAKKSEPPAGGSSAKAAPKPEAQPSGK